MNTQTWRNRLLLSVALATLVSSGQGYAADDKGRYAVRGAGLITCSLYQQQRQARSDIYLMTAAWVDGYISATNQYRPDTYDILSFETTELLTAILNEHCGKNPGDRIFPVVRSLFEKLSNDRLREKSEKVQVIAGERKGFLYAEVLKRVHKALAATGFYKGDIDAHFDQSTLEAVKAFQRSIQFDDTGFPDQMTLWRLLRRDDLAPHKSPRR